MKVNRLVSGGSHNSEIVLKKLRKGIARIRSTVHQKVQQGESNGAHCCGRPNDPDDMKKKRVVLKVAGHQKWRGRESARRMTKIMAPRYEWAIQRTLSGRLKTRELSPVRLRWG